MLIRIENVKKKESKIWIKMLKKKIKALKKIIKNKRKLNWFKENLKRTKKKGTRKNTCKRIRSHFFKL